MKRRQLLWGIGAFCGMLALILDGKTALSGAQEGLELCIKAVIPSLFPFFVLSNLLIGTLSGIRLPALRPLAKLFSLPAGCETLLISGFLGGYPTGAQAVMQAYQYNQVSKRQAERLLAYCNNAGPSFLFGIIAPFFPDRGMIWLLWGIHVLSAMLTAQLFCCREAAAAAACFPSEITITTALQNALRAMGLVCGWVVLFRTLIHLLRRWILWVLPKTFQLFLIGLLELTNGCLELDAVSGIAERFLLCSCFLSLGGMCVLLQTASVTQGLSLRYYLEGKLCQTLFSLILSVGLIYHSWLPACIPFVVILLRKRKKSGSIPGAVGV